MIQTVTNNLLPIRRGRNAGLHRADATALGDLREVSRLEFRRLLIVHAVTLKQLGTAVECRTLDSNLAEHHTFRKTLNQTSELARLCRLLFHWSGKSAGSGLG